MSSRIRLLAGTLLVLGALVALPAPAFARDTDVIRTGSCSGSADWKLKVGREDGGLEVEFQVDSNRVGQEWRVRLRDDGILRASVIRTTKAPSGSFTVRRVIPNLAGTDDIVARARNLATGELCVARISY
jgi:hypothetical protein